MANKLIDRNYELRIVDSFGENVCDIDYPIGGAE